MRSTAASRFDERIGVPPGAREAAAVQVVRVHGRGTGYRLVPRCCSRSRRPLLLSLAGLLAVSPVDLLAALVTAVVGIASDALLGARQASGGCGPTGSSGSEVRGRSGLRGPIGRR